MSIQIPPSYAANRESAAQAQHAAFGDLNLAVALRTLFVRDELMLGFDLLVITVECAWSDSHDWRWDEFGDAFFCSASGGEY